MSAPVRVVEEVPGVEPHWFVAIPDLSRDPPKFDTQEGAIRFCAALGLTYEIEVFEP